MKTYFTLFTFLLVWFFTGNLLSQNQWNYISPQPGSKFIHPESTIAFRHGEKINKSSLDNALIKVEGSLSGLVEGKLVLTNDERTIIFQPEKAFQYKEKITVSLEKGIQTISGKVIAATQFSFSLTQQDNLPLLRRYYLEEYEKQISEQQISNPSASSFNPDRKAGQAQSMQLPEDFPVPLIYELSHPSPGYTFVTPRSWGVQEKFYSVVFDPYGTPVFYRKWPLPNNDLKVVANNRLAFCEFNRQNPSVNRYLVMNSKFEIIDSLTMGNGYFVDQHDLLMDENGNHYLMAYDPQLVGMDTVVEGGDPNATVIGLIIQELDADHNVIFQWRSWDHFEITDGNFIDYTATKIDYSHGNAFEEDTDGNLLISSRHMDEITKIDRNTGNIIWRFGLHAQNNMFEFTNDTIGFYHQHDIRRISNGNITLYDNGNFHDTKISRAVEYELDEVNMTATLVWHYQNNPPVYGFATGSNQRLANNNTLINWGYTWPVSNTETDQNGNKEWELHFPDSISSYRAYRFNWQTDLFTTNWDTIDFGEYDDYVPWINIVRVTNNSNHEITLTGTTNHLDSYSVPTTFPLSIPVGEYTDIMVRFFPNQMGQINDVLTIYSESLFADSLPQLIARQVFLKGSAPDDVAPQAVLLPEDGSTGIAIDTVITIQFNEAVVKADGSTIRSADLAELLVLKENDETGLDVPFTANIDMWKKIIRLKPDTLLPLQDYYVAVPGESFADNSGNILAETQSVVFTTEEGSAVFEESLQNIRIFPNPTSGLVNIETNTHQVNSIRVFKLSGEMILEIRPRNQKLITINLSGQAGGIYLVEMDIEGMSKPFTQKVMKR